MEKFKIILNIQQNRDYFIKIECSFWIRPKIQRYSIYLVFLDIRSSGKVENEIYISKTPVQLL